MMNFYKSVIEHKGKLLVRGILGDKEFKEKLDFGPTLFTLTNEDTGWKTLDNRNLKPTEFTNIFAARKFRKEMPENNPVYGLERYHYQYIGQNYPGQIEWDKNLIKIFTLDIETTC